ncbi:MAG TPA: anti-sigma factor [Chthoniobacterales bacterium]|nr:anti-sigma factor [Chthoniobacterales bacterium]
MVNCQVIHEIIGAYSDGELRAAQNLEIEQHLQGCPNCAPMRQEQRRMAEAIERHAPRFEAPPELRRQVLDSLRAQSSEERVLPFPQTQRWATWAIAALALIGAFVAGVFLASRGTGGGDFLTNEIVASHVRSMMANHLADIVSTDQHTVKPWFVGKLDFAPPVADFAAEGFPLAGGRLDYLAGRPVAALVYRRDKHLINLFVWPSGKRGDRRTTQSRAATQNGYHVLQWADAEMSYAAVSDLRAVDLRQFAQLAGAPRND